GSGEERAGGGERDGSDQALDGSSLLGRREGTLAGRVALVIVVVAVVVDRARIRVDVAVALVVDPGEAVVLARADGVGHRALHVRHLRVVHRVHPRVLDG